MQCQLQWRSCSGKRFPEQRAIMVFSAHNQTPTADGFERTPTPEQLFTPRTHAHSEHCQTGITPLNTWTATLKRIKRQQRCPNKHSEHTWVVAGRCTGESKIMKLFCYLTNICKPSQYIIIFNIINVTIYLLRFLMFSNMHPVSQYHVVYICRSTGPSKSLETP